MQLWHWHYIENTNGGHKRINDLFNESIIIWNECIHSDLNMLEMCEKETGIDVVAKVEEKAKVTY